MRLAVLLFSFTFAANAGAAEFSIPPNGLGISIEGEIKTGDFDRFIALGAYNLQHKISFNPDYIYINSTGGNVEEALKFAKSFSDFFSTVVVAQNNVCFSACTIIWAGGVHRVLHKGARLGFHRLSLINKVMDIDKFKAKINPENDKVTEFFRQVGFPKLIVEKMNETSPSDIYIVDSRWLIDHELDRVVFDQPAFLDVVEQQCGPDPTTDAYKKMRSDLTESEMEKLKEWFKCSNRVKKVNREIRFNNTMKSNRTQ